MNLKHTQAKRLYDSIAAVMDTEKAEGILDKLPLSASPTNRSKSRWACESCQILKENFEHSEVLSIRKACHCKPSPAEVKKVKGMWTESSSLKEFVEKVNTSAQGSYTLELDGEELFLSYPCCYCPFIKRCEGTIPEEWCMCTIGYAEDMYSQVFGKKCNAVLLESIARGASRCHMKITIN